MLEIKSGKQLPNGTHISRDYIILISALLHNILQDHFVILYLCLSGSCVGGELGKFTHTHEELNRNFIQTRISQRKKSVTSGDGFYFARWEVSRGKVVKESLISLRQTFKTSQRRQGSFFWPSLLPEEMHSRSSDHAHNQLFSPKTKVCTQAWIIQVEKAYRGKR